MDDKTNVKCDLETGICSINNDETTSFIDLSTPKEENDDFLTEKLIIIK
ncbi:hypothetical protein [Sporosarcina sp. FA9]